MMKFILLTEPDYSQARNTKPKEQHVLINAEEIETCCRTVKDDKTVVTFRRDCTTIFVKETPEEVYKKIYPAQATGQFELDSSRAVMPAGLAEICKKFADATADITDQDIQTDTIDGTEEL